MLGSLGKLHAPEERCGLDAAGMSEMVRLVFGGQEGRPHIPQTVFFLPISCLLPLAATVGSNNQGSRGNAVCRVPAPASMWSPSGGLELRNSREMKGWDAVDGTGGGLDEEAADRS